MSNNNTVQIIDKIVQYLFGLLFLLFPLTILTSTTEAYVLPKQILLSAVVLLSLLLFGVKAIASEKVKIRRTPFDLPLAAFTLIALVSALIAPNRADALTAFVPLLFSVLSFFLLVNFVKTAAQFNFVISSFLLGGTLASVLSILSYFKIYLLQIPIVQSPTFTPLGAQFDQALYLLFVLSIGWYLSKPAVHHIKDKNKAQKVIYPLLSLLVLVAFGLTVFRTVSIKSPTDKLLLLPLENGFQTALSSVSSDSGRLIWGLLFGSGYGTFVTDFTKFKNPSFNLNPDLWFITFFRSSSFVLEAMTTMGLLGLASYLFLVVRILKNAARSSKSNGLLPAVILALIMSFVLPFSFNIQAVFFFILGLYSCYKGLFDQDEFFDIEIDLVALRRGLFEVSSDTSVRKANKTLPVTFFLASLVFVAVVGFFSYRYVSADMLFQKSLIASAANKGVDTYNYQVNAISTFPWRDGFYRIYSQTNLALANSIAASQPKGSTPNPTTQQTVYTLIQQAISAGRTATAIAPQTYFNWENLSSIYRSLIGFGQNADTFAIASEQQALVLNPNDPQVYINLGGIYFQIGKYDDAQRQFQLAINLKNDYANAHYNLGHSLESKGDFPGALSEYQIVQSLVQASPANLAKINGEIGGLTARIKAANKQQTSQTPSTSEQPPLGISKPQTQLPEQHPPVALPQ